MLFLDSGIVMVEEVFNVEVECFYWKLLIIDKIDGSVIINIVIFCIVYVERSGVLYMQILWFWCLVNVSCCF